MVGGGVSPRKVFNNTENLGKKAGQLAKLAVVIKESKKMTQK